MPIIKYSFFPLIKCSLQVSPLQSRAWTISEVPAYLLAIHSYVQSKFQTYLNKQLYRYLYHSNTLDCSSESYDHHSPNDISTKACNIDQTSQNFHRDQLRGSSTLLRYIGRTSKLIGFYGIDPPSAGEVDEWVDYAPTLANGAEFERTCGYIDGYLERRTFLAGYQLTIADIAVWAQLQGGLRSGFGPNPDSGHGH